MATASCTARLMPTPPTGDIACAASPMQSRPRPVPAAQPVHLDVEHGHVGPAAQLADPVGERRLQRGQVGPEGVQPRRRAAGRTRPSRSRTRPASSRRGRSGSAAARARPGRRCWPRRSSRRDSRNQSTSIGASYARTGSRAACRTVDRRPSAATVSVAGIAPPATVSPVTRPCSTSSPVASVSISSRNPGYPAACRVTKSRKSHCGISAISRCRPGRRRKSASGHSRSPAATRSSVIRCWSSRANSSPKPQLVEQRQRGRVDRVAAEVPQEVTVLLDHRHPQPRPGQQQPEHRPRRPAPRDHAVDPLHRPSFTRGRPSGYPVSVGAGNRPVRS